MSNTTGSEFDPFLMPSTGSPLDLRQLPWDDEAIGKPERKIKLEEGHGKQRQTYLPLLF